MKLEKILNVTFIKAALTRAVKTMAQTAVSLMTVGQAITAMDWKSISAISAGAGVMSLLTSIAAGLPEITPATDGMFLMDTSNPDKDVYQLALDKDFTYYKNKQVMVLEIKPNSKLGG